MSSVELRGPSLNSIDLTDRIANAMQAHRVAVIEDASVYSTDRPVNEHHHGFLGPRGNSEVEAGHTFSLESVLGSLCNDRSKLRMSINSVRIYGSVPSRGVMHYHGYSKAHLASIEQASQVIIFIVTGIGTYVDERTCTVSEGRGRGVEDERSPTVLIYEDEGQISSAELAEGDMIVLPSGIAHTFSALEGVWATYSVVEIATDSKVMYQTHWIEEEGEGSRLQACIARTIGIQSVEPTRILGLGDIPSIKPYIDCNR